MSVYGWIIVQEVQRNGKAAIPAGRWPSLLSLTCPRSSGSGSELSLSSACSEYSSGSHTWAEGRGSSKQVAFIHLSYIYKSLSELRAWTSRVSPKHAGCSRPGQKAECWFCVQQPCRSRWADRPAVEGRPHPERPEAPSDEQLQGGVLACICTAVQRLHDLQRGHLLTRGQAQPTRQRSQAGSPFQRTF